MSPRLASMARLLIAGALTGLLAGPAGAATITVNTDGDVIANDNQCSLREAVIAANTNAPVGGCAAGDPLPIVDTIAFANLPGSPDVFFLTIPGTGEDAAATGDLDITEDVNLVGSADTTIVDGGQVDRVFHIFPGVTVTITDLQIRHGRAHVGAGIENSGTLTLQHTTVTANLASCTYCSVDGAGIRNFGTLTLSDSRVSYNLASCAEDGCQASGGGIANWGSLTLTNSQVWVNTATCTGVACTARGGGIENVDPLTINGGSVVSGNTASCSGDDCVSEGGAIVNLAGVDIVDAGVVDGNLVTCYGEMCIARGGGILNFGSAVTITNSRVSSNHAFCWGVLCYYASGGGVFNRMGALNVGDGALFTENFVHCQALGRYACIASGGGIYNDADGAVGIANATLDDNRAQGHGGGILNNGILGVVASTISRNTAFRGAGLANSATANVLNSTFSGNVSEGSGGGLYVIGDVTLSHSTLIGNAGGTTNPEGGGGVFVRSDGMLTLKNSIVAKSPSGDDCKNQGTFVALGDNLDSDGTCPGFTLPGLNPVVMALANNGGLTETHALVFGSPAIDAAVDCTDAFGNPVTVDQRGAARPAGPFCDLGAYEGVVKVSVSLKKLADLIQRLGLHDRYTGPIHQVLDLLVDGNPANDGAACGKLTALGRQVETGLRRGELTREQAAELGRALASLQGDLGCAEARAR